LQVGALLAVGLVIVAVTQPFLPRLSAPALVALVMFFLGIAFWRAAKDLQGHVQAGAEVAAHMLTSEHHRFEPSDAALMQVEKLLPGIGSLSAVTVEKGGPADKRTLADLNLRGLTGATVVAVSRGDRPLIYPSGRVQLEAGDVLALSGTREAIARRRNASPGHTADGREMMDISEFRRTGHELVDWMADYLRDVERLPVTPDVQPGDIRRSLPAAPPQVAEPASQLMNDFGRLILPGMTHWGHPGFFAYFPSRCEPAVDAGRDAHGDHRRAVHVVADVARRHRAGAGHDGLAAADAPPP
jgi:hypothetical protein